MPNELNPSQMIVQLQRLSRAFAESPAVRAFDRDAAFKTSKKIRVVAQMLTEFADSLDPSKQPIGRIQLFAPATIGRLIGQELIRVPRSSLDSVGEFYGSGVYSIYYKGQFAAYRAITATDCPIYVGVAHPRDRHAISPIEQGKSLSERLRKHRLNIRAANSSLRIEDFEYRYLVTESGWQGTAEDFLIWLYRPVWNKEMKVCSGFGKHGDRARTELSSWDILHGGRAWTQGQQSRRGLTAERVKASIVEHYKLLLSADRDFWSANFNRQWLVENTP